MKQQPFQIGFKIRPPGEKPRNIKSTDADIRKKEALNRFDEIQEKLKMKQQIEDIYDEL